MDEQKLRIGREEFRLIISRLAMVLSRFSDLADDVDKIASWFTQRSAPSCVMGADPTDLVRLPGTKSHRMRIGPISDLSILFRILGAVASIDELKWMGDQRFAKSFFSGTLEGSPGQLLKAVQQAVPTAYLDGTSEVLTLRVPVEKEAANAVLRATSPSCGSLVGRTGLTYRPRIAFLAVPPNSVGHFSGGAGKYQIMDKGAGT